MLNKACNGKVSLFSALRFEHFSWFQSISALKQYPRQLSIL